MKSGGQEVQFGNSLLSSGTRILLDYHSAISRVGSSSTDSRMAVSAIRFEFQATECEKEVRCTLTLVRLEKEKPRI